MGANAQTSVPTFVAGEVLTAANMNISARTGIPVFADSTARDAAFGGTGEKTLAEGQFAYLESTNATQYYDGSAWQALVTSAVLQVKSAVKTDTFSTTSNTFVDVTNLSISITPTSASNKILVLADIKLNGQAGTNTAFARLVRASTAIYLGDAAGSRTPASSASRISTEGVASSGNIFLDSPATTSATTYKVQVAVNAAAAGTIFVNQGSDDSDSSTRGRYASSITVMEVTP